MGGVYRLGIVAAALVGAATAVGAYTFVYAKGGAYLTNNPAACANCHIMSEHYAAWMKGSHRSVATCNDCHTPHNLVGKYLTKAENGFRHSWAFTTGWHPDPITITERDYRITEHACRRCHEPMVAAIDVSGKNRGEVQCVRCHRSVGHWTR